MDQIIIPKHFIGNDRHVILTKNNVSYAENIPENQKKMAKSGFLVAGSAEWDTIVKLYNVSLPPMPPLNYLKAHENSFNNCMGGRVPWYLCMPQNGYKVALQGFLEAVQSQLFGLDLSYYEEWFIKGNFVLDSLVPMKINKLNYERFLKEDNSQILRTFSPSKDGFAEAIEYSRLETVTGRLKVINGPSILLLKKTYRTIIDSSFGKDGEIINFDYKSLEPRILLIEGMKGGRLPYKGVEEDIYEYIQRSLVLNTTIPRDVIKQIIISELYGASINALESQNSSVDFRYVVPKIRELFNIDQIKERLTAEAEVNEGKYISNMYGRKVSIEDAGKYMYPNRYSQSTGVDVSLLGFSAMCAFVKEMNKEELIRPIGVLHDAIQFDIHKSAFPFIPALRKVGAVDIPKYEDSIFYMKSERLNSEEKQ